MVKIQLRHVSLPFVILQVIPCSRVLPCISAAAFSVGIAISGTVIFFAVQYEELSINWWGNYILYGGPLEDGCDANGCINLVIPDAGFGPLVGEFS